MIRGNVDAFKLLYSIETLLVIWISSCSLASSSDGVAFCKAMAKRSSCYIVSQSLASPDVPLGFGRTDDNKDSMPIYIDPSVTPITRSSFLELGEGLGFEPV